jgi:type VI secretion system secreted protein VgrG
MSQQNPNQQSQKHGQQGSWDPNKPDQQQGGGHKPGQQSQNPGQQQKPGQQQGSQKSDQQR